MSPQEVWDTLVAACNQFDTTEMIRMAGLMIGVAVVPDAARYGAVVTTEYERTIVRDAMVALWRDSGGTE